MDSLENERSGGIVSNPFNCTHQKNSMKNSLLFSAVLLGFAVRSFGELSIDTYPQVLVAGEGDFLTFSCDDEDLLNDLGTAYATRAATICVLDDDGKPSNVMRLQKVDENGNPTGAASFSVTVDMYVMITGVGIRGIPSGTVYVTGAMPGRATISYSIKGSASLPRTVQIDVIAPTDIKFRQSATGEVENNIVVAESDTQNSASFYLNFGFSLPESVNFTVRNNAPAGTVDAPASFRVTKGSSDFQYKFKALDGDRNFDFTFTGDRVYTEPMGISISVTNVPPVLTSPSGTESSPEEKMASRGIPSRFMAAASDVAADSSTLVYRWFKDGDLIGETDSNTATVTFGEDGMLGVEAIDKDGGVSNRGWWRVTCVDNEAPPTSAAPDMISSGLIGNNGQSWVETKVRGAGRLTFDWKVSCERRNDSLQLIVDGTAKKRITGEVDWCTVFIDLGPDDHTIRWLYSKNAATYAGLDRAFLDNVIWTPVEATFSDVLDTTGLSWSSYGDAEWMTAVSGAAADGEDCAWSGRAGENGYSRLETVVEGPGTLTFDWCVSGRDGMDWLDFYVDDLPYRSTTGTAPWETVSVEIADGTHVLAWEWFRSYGDYGDEDAFGQAGLDKIVWTGAVPRTDTETETTPVPVPAAWLEAKAASSLAAASGDMEEAANATAANGRPVWECYVADLDPEDPESDLVAGIEWVDGKPVVSILKGESPDRTYKTQGAPEPGGPWGEVTEESRFFRVKADLPE